MNHNTPQPKPSHSPSLILYFVIVFSSYFLFTSLAYFNRLHFAVVAELLKTEFRSLRSREAHLKKL